MRVSQPAVEAGGPRPTTSYTYDAMSNLVTLTDAEGRVTAFDYDPYRRVVKVTYPGPEPRVEEFTYDSAGRLRTRRDRRGVVTLFAYDALGRLVSKSYSDGTPAFNYRYDENGDVGSLTGADHGGLRKLAWDYDLAGQLRAERYYANGTTLTSTVAYAYDAAGNRKELSLDGQLFTSYDYDDASRLSGIWRGAARFGFEYDDAHRRTLMTYPNQVSTAYAYDDLSRLTAVDAVRGGVTAQQVLWAAYSYDDAGNRLSKSLIEYTENYQYDPLYRLKQVDRGAAPTEAYTYDKVGNRKSSLESSNWSYNARNELQVYGSTTFTYDENGNTKTKSDGADNWVYEWNAEDQLVRVCLNITPCTDAGATARFAYDPRGRRVEKVAGGTTTSYTYDGEDLLRETGAGVGLSYVHGPGIDEPLSSEEPATVHYLHADGLGSDLKHTDKDGALTFSRSYDAFGQLQSGATASGYAFTGREWDPETGLYYYRARYYDPKIGRFLSEDPIAVPRRDTRELNPYAYVANNPVNETDPSGLAIWLCNRKAFTRFGPGNHTYFWDDRNGRCCGRGSQLKCKEAGPPTDSCRKVEGSDGHEHKILACCRYNDWGTFFPISNDCHVATNTCLAITGMKNPGAPGGRFGPPCDPCSK